MKSRFFLIILLLTSISCSKYSIKKATNEGKILKGLKASGIILRNPHDQMIRFKDYQNSLKSWLGGYDEVNNIQLLENLHGDLTLTNSTYDRFFQLSSNNKFLKYKSIGVVSTYIKNNKARLKKLFAEKNLDSIIIYEVDSAYTLEMGFIDFESVIAIVDKNFNLAYLDSQSNNYDTDETDPEIMKKHLLDNICERLIITLEKHNYLKKSKGIVATGGKEKEDKKIIHDDIKIDDNQIIEDKKTEEVKDEEIEDIIEQPVVEEKKESKPVIKEEKKKKEESKNDVTKDTIKAVEKEKKEEVKKEVK